MKNYICMNVIVSIIVVSIQNLLITFTKSVGISNEILLLILIGAMIMIIKW